MPEPSTPKKQTRLIHAFIDTNILLNFYHFSKDELDALKHVFASHEHGAATVHLTQQVCDEFGRNRENKIKEALKRFKEFKYSAQLPSFMKNYEEYDLIRKMSNELEQLAKTIIEKVEMDITARQLLADRIIKDIFEKTTVSETTQKIYDAASMRKAIGNPLGKSNSLGDAINWSVLLQSVPDGADLHVISEDGDYYSTINEKAVHPFLEEEWQKKKRSSLFVYRTLSSFLKAHFDGVDFAFDQTKDSLIGDLCSTSSFAATHQYIDSLEAYDYFSLKEVERILTAAAENSQFSWIVTDEDVSDFLKRIAMPKIDSITKLEHREVLKKIAVVESN